MDSKEDKLSRYIDSLNNESKPKEHGSDIEKEEMEELFAAVRKVRSLKEPGIPSSEYPKNLAANINRRLNSTRRWFYGAAAAAAAVALIVILNVAGNTSMDELSVFIKTLTNGTVELVPVTDQVPDKPKVEVAVDLKAEEGDQKNADTGHSPWKLDPVFVSQVFVSLKISPQGIEGDYPVKYEDLKVVKNNGKDAVVEVSGKKNPVRRVYLKKLIRQDSTGIWTVVGYDSVS